jgi:hypothetical protein
MACVGAPLSVPAGKVSATTCIVVAFHVNILTLLKPNGLHERRIVLPVFFPPLHHAHSDSSH